MSQSTPKPEALASFKDRSRRVARHQRSGTAHLAREAGEPLDQEPVGVGGTLLLNEVTAAVQKV
jgi:hypothetical protein